MWKTRQQDLATTCMWGAACFTRATKPDLRPVIAAALSVHTPTHSSKMHQVHGKVLHRLCAPVETCRTKNIPRLHLPSSIERKLTIGLYSLYLYFRQAELWIWHEEGGNQRAANIFRHVGNSSAYCVIRQWIGFQLSLYSFPKTTSLMSTAAGSSLQLCEFF